MRSGFESELFIVEQALKLFDFEINALENAVAQLASNIAHLAADPQTPPPPPPPPPGVGSVLIQVNGCNALAWSGATVTATQGGSVVSTMTTNAGGQAFFSGLSTASTVFAVAPNSTAFATPANQTATIAGGSNPTLTFNLAPATGFACANLTGCVKPLPTTLYLTLLGTRYTLTYSSVLGYWDSGCLVLGGVTILGPTTRPVASFCGATSLGSTAMRVIFPGAGTGSPPTPIFTFPGCNDGSNVVGALSGGCPNSFTDPLQAVGVSASLVCSPFSESGLVHFQFSGPGGTPPFAEHTAYSMSQ